MKIQVTGVNVKITDAMRDMVEHNLEKFHRYFGDDAECDVKFTPENNQLRAELTLKIGPYFYRSEARSPQPEVAIDAAVDNMEGQIRKHKSRMKRKKHTFENVSPFIERLPSLEEEPESSEPQIARVKHFAIESMVPEEAAMQMEMMGHDFHLFMNAETGRVNVIYRRKAGDFGLLEPEY